MAESGRRIKMDGEDVMPDFEGMDLVWTPDKGGNSLKLERFDGLLYFPFYKPNVLENLSKVNMRSDDIYLLTYLRTGTHWSFEILNMLISGKSETITKHKGRHQLECQPNDVLAALPSPRVINTHMRMCYAPRELSEKKCKVIFTLRDPRDVAVSLYHFYRDFDLITDYKGEFKDFFYLFLEGKVDCGGLFGHWRDAERYFDEHPDIPLHILPYEDMSQNPLLEVQKLSDFLGLSRNDDLCAAIAEKCKFKRMKVDKEDFTFKFDDTNPLFRKGIVGDWRNYFTEEMLQYYYRVYEEKMAGSKFYDRYART